MPPGLVPEFAQLGCADPRPPKLGEQRPILAVVHVRPGLDIETARAEMRTVAAQAGLPRLPCALVGHGVTRAREMTEETAMAQRCVGAVASFVIASRTLPPVRERVLGAGELRFRVARRVP